MQRAYPNSQTTTFDYFGVTGDLRLKQIWHKKSGGATLSKFDYEYDVLGRIRHWTQQADAATPQVMTLDYDYEDQLLNAVTTPQNGSSPVKAFAYTYDGMGNRQNEQRDVFTPSQSSAVTSSAYNGVNQLMSQNAPGPVPVQFKGKVSEPATVTVNGQNAQVVLDPDSATGGRTFNATLSLPTGNNTVAVVAKDFGANGGNTTTKNYSVAVTAGAARTFVYDNNGNCTAKGSVTYEWDAEDRLAAINNGTLRSEFTYDGFSRRVKIVEKTNGAITSTKRFIWCGKEICEERDGNNATVARFYEEGFNRYVPSASPRFYTRDHLGSVREVTDNSGTVRARYDYDPYGRVTKVSGDVDSDFLYTGHYYHAPSGMHLALYRAYDSDNGRWLNRDPIEENGGLNLYRYVWNSPLNYIDTDGRWGVGVTGGGAVNVGAGGVGAGATGAVGGGVFWGWPSGADGGFFASGGSFVRESPGVVSFQKPEYGQTPWAMGAYGGVGAGAFLSNAKKPCDLRGPFKQYNLNTPFFSVNFATADGIWIASATIGPGDVGDISGYPTTTVTTPNGWLGQVKEKFIRFYMTNEW